MVFVLRSIFRKMAKKALPVVNGILEIPGLGGEVKIIRDRWGIPHIYAESEEDLFFAQGFVHAQDRLWQMELYRRVSQGRLSEIFGEVALETDKSVRTFGFLRLGKKDMDLLSENVMNAMKAYTRGVNAWVNSPNFALPVEFKLLKIGFEPWKVEDSMAFGRLMQWQLSGQFHYKIYQALAAKVVGGDKMKAIDPLYPSDVPDVLSHLECNKILKDGGLQSIKGPYLNRMGGSNAWSISGNRTLTGKPIHSNDPHLKPSLPSIWYAIHLICKNSGYNVFGVGPPVVPMILIGHNARISWGFTVANADAEDIYLERINPDNSHQYLYNDEWVDMEVIRERIKVKGKKEPVQFEVLLTRHGPLISGAVGIAEGSDERFALKSRALMQSTIFDGIYRLNKAGNWDEFVEAVSYIDCPQQNLSYADVEGNIGSYVSGKIPIRKKGDGSVPVPGWTDEYEWEGYIPFEEMPHCLNPKKGFVVTANNRPITPENYPYFLGKVWDPGYRAKRIEELIGAEEKISVDDVKKIHVDTKSYAGLEFVSLISDVEFDDRELKEAADILKEWDGFCTPESVGATLYNMWSLQILRDLFHPVLGEELGDELIGKGFHPLLKGTNEAYHSQNNRLFRLMRDRDNWWWKRAGGFENVLKTALMRVIDRLKDELGPDPSSWQWGRVNRIIYPHAMGVKKPLDKVFNIGPFPTGGDKFSPLQMGPSLEDFDNKEWAPSYRQIVDLSDLDNSLFVFPPGESGNVASPHYSDLVVPFVRGEYIPMAWSSKAVEEIKAHELLLKGKK